MTDIGMIERSWDVARTQTNPTIRLTLDIARQKVGGIRPQSGVSKNNLTQIGRFLGNN